MFQGCFKYSFIIFAIFYFGKPIRHIFDDLWHLLFFNRLPKHVFQQALTITTASRMQPKGCRTDPKNNQDAITNRCRKQVADRSRTGASADVKRMCHFGIQSEYPLNPLQPRTMMLPNGSENRAELDANTRQTSMSKMVSNSMFQGCFRDVFQG